LASHKRVDYRSMERRYITTDLSLRALAKEAGIGWGTLAQHSRNDGWVEKRAEYRAQADQRALESAEDQFVNRSVEIREEAVNVMRATLYAYADNLKDKPGIVTTRDAALAIDKLLLLLGEPTSRTEERHVFGSDITSEDLREIIAASRARIIEGSSSDAANAGAEEARA
jgi:hypothetical protein